MAGIERDDADRSVLEEPQMSHRTMLGVAAGCLLSLALGACAAHGPTEVQGDATAATTTTIPTTPPNDAGHHHTRHDQRVDEGGRTATSTPKPPTTAPRLYFETPQAAMRYLAAAYNRHDTVALKHVTTPVARTSLEAMRPMADNLRLVNCKANAGRGDHLCEFTHDYPATARRTGHGQAHFTAAPAARYGWYMTILNDCS
jgi:hypothetical protein